METLTLCNHAINSSWQELFGAGNRFSYNFIATSAEVVGMRKRKSSKVRRQGRPVATENGVGREALLIAALELLHELPPALITISSIARAANVDPALVRYYFGSRENLILEIVDRLVQEAPQPALHTASAETAVRDTVRNVFRFTRSAKYMHRLMIDELATSESQALREKARSGNQLAIDVWRDVLTNDHRGDLAKYDPLLLHIAVVGMSDFFMSAMPIIQLLQPKADIDKLAKRYEAFVIDLVLNGLLKRKT